MSFLHRGFIQRFYHLSHNLSYMQPLLITHFLFLSVHWFVVSAKTEMVFEFCLETIRKESRSSEYIFLFKLELRNKMYIFFHFKISNESHTIWLITIDSYFCRNTGECDCGRKQSRWWTHQIFSSLIHVTQVSSNFKSDIKKVHFICHELHLFKETNW